MDSSTIDNGPPIQPVYFDTAGTTFIPSHIVEKSASEWFNNGNPSSSNAKKSAKTAIAELKHLTLEYLRIDKSRYDEFEFIITSGASEANAHIVNAAIDLWRDSKNVSIRSNNLPDISAEYARGGVDYIPTNTAHVNLGPTWSRIPHGDKAVTTAYEENKYYFEDDQHPEWSKFVPRILCSSVEHKSMISAVDSCTTGGKCSSAYLPVNSLGFVSADIFSDEITKNDKSQLCLISVMGVNNEIGSVTDLTSLYNVVKRLRGEEYARRDDTSSIPIFHSDCAQVAGSGRFEVIGFDGDMPADAISISYHKLHGPTGIGALIIRKNLEIGPLIHGTQNNGLRGGTENVSGIMGAVEGLKYIKLCDAKFATYIPQSMYYTTDYSAEFISLLEDMGYVVIGYPEYLDATLSSGDDRDINDDAPLEGGRDSEGMSARRRSRRHTKDDELEKRVANIAYNSRNKCAICILSPIDRLIASDKILLFSVISPGEVCNTKLKNHLALNGFQVSIGSACNTKSKYASHVIDSLGGDKYIRRGVLRASFGKYHPDGSILINPPDQWGEKDGGFRAYRDSIFHTMTSFAENLDRAIQDTIL